MKIVGICLGIKNLDFVDVYVYYLLYEYDWAKSLMRFSTIQHSVNKLSMHVFGVVDIINVA